MLNPKPKPCPICKTPFVKYTSLQKVCGQIACAIEQGRLDIENNRARLERARLNDDRKALREAKDSVKTRQEWIKDVQAVFNKFIRLRDASEPCISCGRYHSGQYHAGHYRTTKAAPQIRYHEDNCHKQCQPCNAHLSGNLLEYRPRLITKIGIDRVLALESNNDIKRYSIDELKAIKADYRAKLKELKEINNNSF